MGGLGIDWYIVSQISAPTISTSFDFRDLVKERVMSIAYVQK